MNIFETIRRVSGRDEPYHSMFLADALKASLDGERSLFEALWWLSVPESWKPPTEAFVTAEESAANGSRIDVCIRCERPNQRLVGIEVKTSEDSAEVGQLERYQEGFAKRFVGYEIQIAYLTPFNRERAGEAWLFFPTIKVFDRFAKTNPEARHISWMDVATIPWDGNELWKQHQMYVWSHISNDDLLQPYRERLQQTKERIATDIRSLQRKLAKLGE